MLPMLILAKTMRMVPHMKQLWFGWTRNSPQSHDLEQFVMDILPQIRANNPCVRYVLHPSYVECVPFIIAEYEHRRKLSKAVPFHSREKILTIVNQMAIGGDYRPGRKRGVKTALPRGAQLWDTETMGHDVYKVYSKRKAGDSL